MRTLRYSLEYDCFDGKSSAQQMKGTSASGGHFLAYTRQNPTEEVKERAGNGSNEWIGAGIYAHVKGAFF